MCPWAGHCDIDGAQRTPVSADVPRTGSSLPLARQVDFARWAAVRVFVRYDDCRSARVKTSCQSNRPVCSAGSSRSNSGAVTTSSS